MINNGKPSLMSRILQKLLGCNHEQYRSEKIEVILDLGSTVEFRDVCNLCGAVRNNAGKFVSDKAPKRMFILKAWIYVGYYILPRDLYTTIVNSSEWYDCYYKYTIKCRKDLISTKKRAYEKRKSIIGY